MNKYKEIIIPTVVMILICLVVTVALSGTNLITKDKIQKIQKSQQDESMREVLPADEYAEKTGSSNNQDYTYYIATKSGETSGYIFVTTEKGYGGDVKVMTAVSTNGSIEAVKVLDVSEETPGLGQNTGKEIWYSQFSGINARGEISVQKSGASKETATVNAVTGATISSTAVTKAVNKAVSYYSEISAESEVEINE